MATSLEFTCEICLDTKTEDTIFKCFDHNYCSICMHNYIVSNRKLHIIQIPCPTPSCTVFLDPNHCQSIIPRKEYDKWIAAISKDLAFRKLHCPCCSTRLQLHIKSVAATRSECPECSIEFCAQCKVAWHVGLNCKEFLRKEEGKERDVRIYEPSKKIKWKKCSSCKYSFAKKSIFDSIGWWLTDRASKKDGDDDDDDIKVEKLARRKGWKQCPYCCVFVKKISGCCRRTCRCGCHFCYRCGVPHVTKWDMTSKGR